MAKQVRLGHLRLDFTGMSGAFDRSMTWSAWAKVNASGVATLTCPNGSCAQEFEVHALPCSELRALQDERRSKPFIVRWFTSKVQPYTLKPLSGGSTAFHEVQVSG